MSMKYDLKQISEELAATAMGQAYYGNALYVAKAIPSLTEEEQQVISRFLEGGQRGGPDCWALHAIAVKLLERHSTDKGTLEGIIDAVLQHDAEHPDHGRGCACHDRHAGAIRRLLRSRGLYSLEHQKSLQNVLTVVGYVTRNP